MSAIQRMIDQMRHRGYAAKTIAEYSGSVRRLAAYFGCCPSELSVEQLREYQVHLSGRNDISASYYNATVTAMKAVAARASISRFRSARLPMRTRECSTMASTAALSPKNSAATMPSCPYRA